MPPKGKAKAKKPATTGKSRMGTRRKAWNKSSLARVSNYHKFKRHVNLGSIFNLVMSNNAQSPVFTPKFSDMNGYAEFAALFDEWKLDKVVLHFEPTFDGKDAYNPMYSSATPPVINNNGLDSSLKYLRTIVDYNDSTAIANEGEAFEYQAMKSHRLGKPFTVTLYPKILTEAYRSALTTSYYSSKPRFISTSDSGQPHYGLKCWLNPTTVNIDGNVNKSIYNVTGDYYFTCRNVK